MSSDNNPENLPARSDDRFLPARVDYVGGTLDMIRTAIDKGMEPESLGKLLDLQDRVLDRQAETEFNAAKRAFQAECPFINRNKSANIPNGPSYDYADLEHIIRTIRPLLDRCGFTYGFTQKADGAILTVTCILKHEAGHSEERQFSAPWAQKSGAVSEMQKFAMATTFCERYSLCLALGLPIGKDRDGADPEHPTPKQKANAPQPKTRGQRQNQEPPPEDPPSDEGEIDPLDVIIEPAELDRLIKEWKTQQPGSPGKEEFAKWALEVVPGDWNPSRLLGWTRGRADKCWAKLGVPT